LEFWGLIAKITRIFPRLLNTFSFYFKQYYEQQQ
jgi:hypothetical protein